MSIISKDTWDNMPEKEKTMLRENYEHLYDAEQRILLNDIFPEGALQPQSLTYEDVVKELFKDGAWQIGDGYMNDEYGYFDESANETYSLNMTSRKQAEKLLAINKLLNVAQFLNGKDWKPDWSDSEEKKFFPSLINNEIRIGYVMRDNSSPVYFRTEELAKQAIQILGEDIVRLALTTEY